jgi:acetate kinase
MKILAINGGSSSFKCRLDEIHGDPPSAPPAPLWEAHFDLKPGALEGALRSVSGPVDIIGHRIVHGGPKYRQTTRITAEVHAAIAAEAEVAPTHNRFELEAIDCAGRIFPDVPQVAVFDAAFHSTLRPEAYVYPGPYDWLSLGIRRYGFHGVSFQYATRRATEILAADSARLVICHLGNGASIAAVRDGKSVDTTMGFTPLEGLMMGTRSGSIDPGIIIYLIRHRGYTAAQLDTILNRESGLLGISGVSGDMREILTAIDQGNDRARLAFDIYAHRLSRGIGAMLAAMDGADAIVFTGGVGENCAPLRDRVRQQLRGLLQNARELVIHAEEEWEIVRECLKIESHLARQFS